MTNGILEFLDSIESAGGAVKVVSGLGLVTIILAALQRYLERRRWRLFKVRAHNFVERFVKLRNEDKDAGKREREITELELNMECERLLVLSGFSPGEIERLMKLAIIVVQGFLSDENFPVGEDQNPSGSRVPK